MALPGTRRMTGLLASVVIPAYQKRASLPHTLHSLALQTLPADSFEVIVVDDGSTDLTGDVLRSFRHRLGRLRYIRKRRVEGAAAARNTGLERATGAICIFVDADVVAGPTVVQQHVDLHRAGGDLAGVGYVYGREVTPDTWPLKVGGHTGWRLDDPVDLLSRAEREPGLHDPLDAVFAANGRGRPNLSAPWAYFWSTNVSIRTDVLTAMGGFDLRFPAKGNEDVELGYRLHAAGHTIHFLRSARVFHQPHPRDRRAELLVDRDNERRLLERHPCLDVEAVCSFDIDNGNAMIPILSAWARTPGLGSYDAGAATAFPVLMQRLRQGGTLLIGAGRSWPGELPLSAAIDVVPEAVTLLRGRFPDIPVHQLMGVRLPFGDRAFKTVLITDYWRQLPVRLLARLLQEALRCGEVVFLLKTSAYQPLDVPEFRAAVERLDRPFWEFAVGLRRELHDFRFQIEDARVAGGPTQASLIRVRSGTA
jgi:glycosyltransferase involved in cell wall biosynthesis